MRTFVKTKVSFLFFLTDSFFESYFLPQRDQFFDGDDWIINIIATIGNMATHICTLIEGDSVLMPYKVHSKTHSFPNLVS